MISHESIYRYVYHLGTLRGTMLQILLKESTIDLAAVKRQMIISTVLSYAVQPEKWLPSFAGAEPSIS